MKFKLIPIALVSSGVILSLNGCSSIKDLFKSTPVNYENTKQIPNLAMPPDLTAPTVDGHYIVNTSATPGSATLSNYMAGQAAATQPPSAASVTSNPTDTNSTANTPLPPSGDGVQFEHSDGERWLVVNQTPAQIWPKLVQFWQNNGYQLAQNNPKLGIMQTEWQLDSDKLSPGFIPNSSGTVTPSLHSSYQYRTRIEQASNQTNQTEVYITERAVTQVRENKANLVWQAAPNDPGLEAEMLIQLMQTLGIPHEKAQTMLQGTGPTGLAHIIHDDKNIPSLHDNESFDLAWRRVGIALEHAGYNVVNSDRNTGIYTFTEDQTAAQEEQPKSLLDKLEFWKSSHQDNAPYQVELDEDSAATHTDVKVLDAKGNPASLKASTRIINKLYEQLK